jgi:hypothetical protein
MKQKLPLKKVKTKIDELLEEAIRKRGLTDKTSQKVYIDPKKKDKNKGH